jgi:hypothetical protein
MRREIEEVMSEDQEVTGVNIINIESKDDINYDEYYD